MRLRSTAPPTAFLMLHPNRLRSSPLGRRKTANSRLLRRRPSRYTASYSARCTRRQLRGRSSRGVSDAREAMTPFPAALCKNFSSTLAFHPCAESVLLVAGAHMRLISAFRQRSLSSGGAFLPSVRASTVDCETISVCDSRSTVKAPRSRSRQSRCGKSPTPRMLHSPLDAVLHSTVEGTVRVCNPRVISIAVTWRLAGSSKTANHIGVIRGRAPLLVLYFRLLTRTGFVQRLFPLARPQCPRGQTEP